MTGRIHQKRTGVPPGRTPGQHGHGFGGGGRFVEQRGIGDSQPGEIRHGGLKIQKRLQPTLRNFGLVRRVLCVPVRIFQYVAPDHRRRHRIVVTHPYVRPAEAVLVGQCMRFRKKVPFAEGFRQIKYSVQANIRRNRAGDQLIQRGTPHLFEHLADVFFRRPVVPLCEAVGRGKRGGHG